MPTLEQVLESMNRVGTNAAAMNEIYYDLFVNQTEKDVTLTYVNPVSGAEETVTFANDAKRWSERRSKLKKPGGSSDAVVVDAAGKVGIGTTTPSTRLHVKDLTPILTIQDTSADYDATQAINFSAGNNLRSQISSIVGGGAQGNILFSNGLVSMAERMRIDYKGDVGIGELSPARRLAVRDVNTAGFVGVRIVNSNVNTGLSGIELGSDYTYVKSAIALVRTDFNGAGDIVFFNDSNADASNWLAGDEKMRLKSTGNLGVGTPSPGSYRLNVHGADAYCSHSWVSGGADFAEYMEAEARQA